MSFAKIGHRSFVLFCLTESQEMISAKNSDDGPALREAKRSHPNTTAFGWPARAAPDAGGQKEAEGTRPSKTSNREATAGEPSPQRGSSPPTPIRRRVGTCGRLIHLLGLPAIGGLNAGPRPVVERLLDRDGAGNAAHGAAEREGAQPGQEVRQQRSR